MPQIIRFINNINNLNLSLDDLGYIKRVLTYSFSRLEAYLLL